MELRQLEYFQMASRLQNITRAAERLRVSQPNITVAIKKLEAERAARAAEEKKAALAVAKKLEGLSLTVSAPTTDGKKLYGAVSVTDLLAAIEAQRGVKIERGQFSLEESLREVGEYEAKIDLGHGVFAKCRIEILDEAAPAE